MLMKRFGGWGADDVFPRAPNRFSGACSGLTLGRGQIVLIGFEPHFRGQPRNTYKLLFNPLFASTLDEAVWSRPDAGVTQGN
jgi:hypothetical protein